MQRQQLLQDLFITQIRLPTPGCKNCLIKPLVGQVETGRAGVVEVGEGSLFLLGVAETFGIEPAS